jgi:hypothetical protein
MATDWIINNLTIQPGGKTTVVDISLLEDGIVVARFSVAYTDAKMFKEEVARKTAKYQLQTSDKTTKRAEAEALLLELKEGK